MQTSFCSVRPATHADKNPAGFPAETLFAWKANWEAEVSKLGSERRFSDQAEMRNFVFSMLAENHEAWKTLGPKSEIARLDPGSNAYLIWELRKADLIIPNNRRIINALEANKHLMTSAQLGAFASFKNHAEGFAENQTQRLDFYPIFPENFSEEFAP